MRVYIGQQTKWEPIHRCGLRVWEHNNDLADGFCKQYAVHSLVWYEVHEIMESAIGREKAIKNYPGSHAPAWERENLNKEEIWKDSHVCIYWPANEMEPYTPV